MTLKSEVDKLKSNSIFSRIYSKHRMRRHRDPKISLEQCQRNALREFKEFIRSLQVMGKEYTPTSEETGVTIPDFKDEEKDYYVMVNGRSMLDSEYRRLISEQERVGDVRQFPSRHPDSYVYVYLKSLFKDDKEKPHKDRSVDLWNE